MHNRWLRRQSSQGSPAQPKPISADDVRWGYRTILGREPESEAVIEEACAARASVRELVEVLLSSTEYLERYFPSGVKAWESTPADYPEIAPESTVGAKLYANRHQMITDLGVAQGGMVAEVGVAHGEFSDFLLRELKPSHFYALDLFEMEKTPLHWGIRQEELFHGKTHYDFYRDRFANIEAQLSLLRGRSIETLAELPDASFGLIYIDANHDYEHVSKEGAISAQKIKQDGILVFNDYVAYDPFIKCEYGVVAAVNEMLNSGHWRVVGFALQRAMFCDIAITRV